MFTNSKRKTDAMKFKTSISHYACGKGEKHGDRK